MKRVFGYALGLVAALSLAGVAATSANADGNAANAASGNSGAGTSSVSSNRSTADSSSAASDSIASSSSATSNRNLDSSSSSSSDNGFENIIWWIEDYYDAGNASAPTATASSTPVSSSSSSSVAPARSLPTPKKRALKRFTSSEKIRGVHHYYRGERDIFFSKGRKGEVVTLRNRDGQFVKRYDVKRNGSFEIKLSKKQARKLDRFGKHFDYVVSDKGYRVFEKDYTIYK